MNNKKIIIFIPCYNRKEFIKDALESIVNQSYKNKKIVVVDDNSDDGTYELLEELNKKWDFILLKTDSPKRGPYWISNMVMKTYPAEFYQILDSDDWLYPDATKKLMNFLIKEDADIVGGQQICIDAEGNNHSGDNRRRPYNPNYAFEIKRGAYINHSGMLWKGTVIDKIGYFNDSTICTSDYEFFLKALTNNIIIRNLNERILKYRVHINSLSNSFRFGKINFEMENNIKRINSLYPSFYHIEFRFLDFFVKELELISNTKRDIMERWCLEYIAFLIRDKKIEDCSFIFSMLEGIKILKSEANDIRILLYFSSGDIKKAEELFEKSPYPVRGIWAYRTASIYKILGAYGIAENIFKGMLKQADLEIHLKSGVHFHLGELYLQSSDSLKAISEFNSCLRLNPEHKKAKEYLNNNE